MNDKPTKNPLLDSALLIAAIGGTCYALGLISHLSSTRNFKIPWHLIPEMPLHQTLVVGAIYLLILVSVALLVYLLYVYLLERFHRIKRVEKYFKSRFTKHKNAFTVFLCIILITVLCLVPICVQNLFPKGRGIFHNRQPPRVIELCPVDLIPAKDLEFTTYICRKDGVIVLAQESKNRCILLNEKNVEKLVLEVQK